MSVCLKEKAKLCFVSLDLEKGALSDNEFRISPIIERVIVFGASLYLHFVQSDALINSRLYRFNA